MTRLLRVELTRLRCRRAALLLLAAALVVPIVMAVVIAAGQSAPSGNADAEAQARAEREIALCVDNPRDYGLEDLSTSEVQAQCAEFNQPEYYYDYNTLDLDYEREESSGVAVVAVLMVLMFLLGTTFVGHDWATGSMSNQLLFEPRRLRIWLAKAVAVGGAALVASIAGATAFWLVLFARYSSGDVSPGDGVILDCLQQGWRGAFLAAAAGVGGYVLTMLSRSTVFTLGVLFGVSVAGGILIAAAVDDPGPWDPTINAAAVIKDGTTYYVDVPDRCYMDQDYGGSDDIEPGSTCDQELDRSLGQGVTYLVVLLGAVGAASAASFRRRDVP